MFNYPFVMWQRDADLTADLLGEAIEGLTEVGLVEWDPEEQSVRIVDFRWQRPPENASMSTRLAADFSEMLRRRDSSVGLVIRAAAEFAVAVIQRSGSWKPDSPDFRKLRDVLGPFLRGICYEHEDKLPLALQQQANRASKATPKEIRSLLPALSMSGTDRV